MQLTHVPNNYANCSNRLPCGVCRLTNQICPISFTGIEPTCTTNDTGTNPRFQTVLDIEGE